MGSGGGPGGMADIFDLFTGGGGGGRGRSQRERRSEDVNHKLVVTLEDLYNGCTKKMSLSRNLPCDPCHGTGTKSGKKYECSVGQEAALGLLPAFWPVVLAKTRASFNLKIIFGLSCACQATTARDTRALPAHQTHTLHPSLCATNAHALKTDSSFSTMHARRHAVVQACKCTYARWARAWFSRSKRAAPAATALGTERLPVTSARRARGSAS